MSTETKESPDTTTLPPHISSAPAEESTSASLVPEEVCISSTQSNESTNAVSVEESESRSEEENPLVLDNHDDDDFEDMTSIDSVSVSSLQTSITKRYVQFKFHNSGPTRDTVSVADLKVDSGAELNVMPLKKFQELHPSMIDSEGQPLKQCLKKETKKLTLVGYGGSKIDYIGKVVLRCEYDGKKFLSSFYISDVDSPILLGLPLGEALDIKSSLT